MTNYRPVDSKREEFRKYLERAGVMESLTRVLVSLYEEPDKGIDALEYVKNQLAGDRMTAQSSSEEQLKSQIEALLAENQMLRKRLSQYEDVQLSEATPSPSKTQTLPKGSASIDQPKTEVSSTDQPEQDPSVNSNPKSV